MPFRTRATQKQHYFIPDSHKSDQLYINIQKFKKSTFTSGNRSTSTAHEFSKLICTFQKFELGVNSNKNHIAPILLDLKTNKSEQKYTQTRPFTHLGQWCQFLSRLRCRDPCFALRMDLAPLEMWATLSQLKK